MTQGAPKTNNLRAGTSCLTTHGAPAGFCHSDYPVFATARLPANAWHPPRASGRACKTTHARPANSIKHQHCTRILRRASQPRASSELRLEARGLNVALAAPPLAPRLDAHLRRELLQLPLPARGPGPPEELRVALHQGEVPLELDTPVSVQLTQIDLLLPLFAVLEAQAYEVPLAEPVVPHDPDFVLPGSIREVDEDLLLQHLVLEEHWGRRGQRRHSEVLLGILRRGLLLGKSGGRREVHLVDAAAEHALVHHHLRALLVAQELGRESLRRKAQRSVPSDRQGVKVEHLQLDVDPLLR
mmetsp:Transcript_11394/g.40415  ORF Transcript_11394/g.40415 Transcript_11394/m.40415 type:complete len:300 (-) Transcript_11394:524-1423(-)